MLQRLSARLARIEARTDHSRRLQLLTLWIGDPLPDDIDDRTLVLWLPRKCETEDDWVRLCEGLLRQRPSPEEEHHQRAD